MGVVEFRRKGLTDAERREKARAKKIYDNFKKTIKKGGKVEPDPFTVEFLRKYGYEL